MLSLFEGYLLIFVALFAVNMGLFLGNFKINNLKAISVAIISGILLIVVNYVSSYFKVLFSFLTGDFGFLFLVVSVLLFVLTWIYLKKENSLKKITCITTILFYIVILCIDSHIFAFSLFNSLLLTLFLVIIMFVVYQLSKLLLYAKREYLLIVGEYMILESILIFILGLTYWSVKELDYSMFSSYLILTPTYQVVYVIILIIFILILGLYYNDKQLKKR
ncbi:peptide ABC transporter permease [uncultured Methanobrevibacter sp.]|uniref:peptide ABC transporter permease n=1 Tax=uncultured Methanobrevibacter sp. TaxID=253161 RepID=UPI002625EBCF|nr:peptide ABC transporter permease [uncultured Methanobrevibacter sp.]